MHRQLLFLLLLFSTGLYAQPVHLAGKSYSDKYHYIDSLEQAPIENDNDTKRKARADRLEKWSAESTDAELSAMLHISAYKLRAGTQGEDTAARERELGDMLEEYGGNKYLRADVLQLLGKFHLDVRKRNSHAFEYFLMAYKEYKDLDPDEFPAKSHYLYDLAGAYYRYEDYGNAIKYMNKTLETPRAGEQRNNNTILNTIGLSYRELRQYDSAMMYFTTAYEAAREQQNQVWMGILSGNMGEVYYQVKDNRQAIAKLEECINLCLANNIKRNAIMAACRLAGIYLEQGNAAKAKATLDKVAQLHEGINRPEHYVAQRLYSVMSKTYAASGNIALAYLYADSALRAKDSAYAEQLEINRVRAAEKAEYVQDKLELSQVAHEKQRQFLVRNSLIILIVAVTLIGLLFINHQRLKHKKLVAELAIVTNKLIHARAAEAVKPGNRGEMMYEREEEGEIDPETLSRLENATLLTNEQWDEFRKLFDKVHKGFLNNLKRKRPELSPADIRFIALTKLRLSSKEMASMLGVSPGTIRIYKFRLRKKLGLDKEDIEDFVSKL